MRLATVTYSPTVILTGVKSLSYGANMQATRIAQARGADEALLVRPDGIVLEAPTSSIFWVSPEGGLRTPSIGSGILESITRAQIVQALHVEEGEFGRGRPARDARGVPRLHGARGPAGRGDRRASSLEIPGAEDDGGGRGVQPLAGAGARRRLGCTAVDLDLTDEQRLISETARDFADNEIVPRARDNDRAARFDRRARPPDGRHGLSRRPVAEEYGGRASTT